MTVDAGHDSAAKKHGADDGPLTSAPQNPPRPKKPKQRLSEPERRASALAFELNLRLESAEKDLSTGKATQQDEAGIRAMTDLIDRNRDELGRMVALLPTSAPLQIEAFQLLDRATVVIARLGAVERAAHGHANSSAPATSDKERIFQQAAAKGPVGYCDGDGKADHDHCGLKDEERAEYRTKISTTVLQMQINWMAAVNAKKVEELLRSNKVPFEQKLGQALLDLLFSGFGAAAKYAGGKLVSKAVKATTTKTELGTYPGVETNAPSEAVVGAAKKGVDSGIKKGVGAVQKAVTGHKTAKQLHDDAAVAAPADRIAFIDIMKSAPSTWSSSILDNLNQLYDEDLASLFVSLPNTAPTQGDFEQWIDSMLTRFDQQVLAVNGAQRPIQVVTAGGVLRHALVVSEQRADANLKGDARHSLVDTGKTRFVRWIDDDMSEMAQEHSVQHDPMRAMQEVRRFDDSGFWSDDSLTTLARTPAGPPASAKTASPLVAASP